MRAFLICSLFVLGGCKGGSSGSNDDGQDPGTTDGGNPQDTGSSAGGGAGGAGGVGGSGGSRGGTGGNVPRDAGVDTAPGVAPDVAPIDCAGALFCENFDNYATVTTIADRQRFGPWQATLRTGATMVLDGTHTVSGSKALHVHVDSTVTSGGRLFAGSGPIFTAKATHLYGRMMMYINPNGTSVHWTFFGVNGPAEPGSPVSGIRAQYIMSSLPARGVNTYSFVYGLSAPGGYQDCSSRSTTAMPTGWACVSFEMDSVARKLRMYKDGAASPILSVDNQGRACVPPTPATSPWYGPVVSQLFVGAWSFHPMNAPLDVWIDDLVVDTKPVPCTAP